MKIAFLVAAAGMGERLGLALPKALASLQGRPLLLHTLDRLNAADLTRGVVIVPPGFEDQFRALLSDRGVEVVPGGAHRQASVLCGLNALDEDTDVVVIHDAARPFVRVASIQASIKAAVQHGAATVAIPSIDTILEEDGAGFLQATPDRGRLWACQTPQTFRYEVIRDAHRKAAETGFLGTDDASLVRRAGGCVKLVQGSRNNIKITVPEDLRMAEILAREGLT